MKNILIGLFAVLTVGCSSIGKFVPSEFDNVEYGKLVELSVLSLSHGSTEEWCKSSMISQMNYRAEYLHTYAKHRLNDNIVEIYKGIHDLTLELKEKENPSEAYCKIKRTNIHNVTNNVLSVFGDRK